MYNIYIFCINLLEERNKLLSGAVYEIISKFCQNGNWLELMWFRRRKHGSNWGVRKHSNRCEFWCEFDIIISKSIRINASFLTGVSVRGCGVESRFPTSRSRLAALNRFRNYSAFQAGAGAVKRMCCALYGRLIRFRDFKLSSFRGMEWFKKIVRRTPFFIRSSRNASSGW